MTKPLISIRAMRLYLKMFFGAELSDEKISELTNEWEKTNLSAGEFFESKGLKRKWAEKRLEGK